MFKVVAIFLLFTSFLAMLCLITTLHFIITWPPSTCLAVRALHHNRKHTAIWVFYTGTCTVPFGLAVQYLMAITNTDIYHIDQFNLLPYYGIYRTIRVDLNFYFHSISMRNWWGSSENLSVRYLPWIRYVDQSFPTCLPSMINNNLSMFQPSFNLFQHSHNSLNLS